MEGADYKGMEKLRSQTQQLEQQETITAPSMKEQMDEAYTEAQEPVMVEDGTKMFQWEMETLLDIAQSNEEGDKQTLWPLTHYVLHSPKLPILGQLQLEDMAD